MHFKDHLETDPSLARAPNANSILMPQISTRSMSGFPGAFYTRLTYLRFVWRIPVVCYQYIPLCPIVSSIIYLPVFARTYLQSTVFPWAMPLVLSLLSRCKLAEYTQTGSHCSALLDFFEPTCLLPQHCQTHLRSMFGYVLAIHGCGPGPSLLKYLALGISSCSICFSNARVHPLTIICLHSDT